MRLTGQPHTRPGTWDTGMHHQDFVVDQVKQRKISEGLREEVEEIQVVLGSCFSCKAVDHIGLQHFVITSVHENSIGVLHLHGKDQDDDLNRPGAAVNKVAVEQERRVRGRHTSHVENVHEVKVLAMKISKDRQFLARTHLHAVHGLLRLQLSNDIKNQEIGVLLWNETSGLLELLQPLQPRIVNVSCLRVTGAIISWCRLWHGHGSLTLLHQVLIGPAAQTWHPGSGRSSWSCSCGLLHGLHFDIFDGHGEGYLLMLSHALSSSFEGSGGLDIRIRNEVLKEVHDVFKVPIADIRAIHRLDHITFLHSSHCCLSDRITWVTRLFVHVHNHCAFPIHAVRIPLDAAGPLLELDCVSRTHR
mmetsp:Transcript_62613/g.99112  ORF Transcript_62613/g.99112 Transcript_62613/m.99112 type:complete len:360 (+) Transcript_62613:758-1837(+)